VPVHIRPPVPRRAEAMLASGARLTVGAQVVQHQHRIGLGTAQLGQQHPVEVGGEHGAARGGVHGHRRDHAADPERAQDGQSLPMPAGHRTHRARAARAAAPEPGQVGQHAALVHKSADGRGATTIAVCQAVRCDTGMPSRVIRLSTEQATLDSVFWAGRVRARRPRPMIAL
jgi:hypothetical protein